MNNLSPQTPPAQGEIAFDAPGDPIDEAIALTGEHDSTSSTNDGPVTGRLCAACGEFEPDYGDSIDGIHMVAVRSDALRACTACDDCLIHPACAVTVECIVHDPCTNASDRKAGLCPHCSGRSAIVWAASKAEATGAYTPVAS